MITKYNTEYEKDNIILIVNLDFNYEIADFNFKDFTKNLKEEIIDIAKRTNAKKVKIIMNGILISTLLLAPLSLENGYNDKNIFIKNNTIKDSFNMTFLEKENIVGTSNQTNIKEKENTNNNSI